TATGEGLSKRSGALSIASLREEGIEPMAVASLAVLIGTSGAVAACHDMAELSERFDPGSSSKSAAKFDPAELKLLSRTLIQSLPYEDAAPRLERLGISGPNAEPFWQAVRGNIDTLSEAA